MAALENQVDYTMIFSIPECNLFCNYCRKDEIKSKGILTNGQILELASVCYDVGIRKVRWTGGEPTARKNFVNLVSRVRERGIEEQYLSTNGILLHRIAPNLRRNGIKRINISLDTFNRKRFYEITGSDKLEDVLKSIKISAQEFDLVKINSVLMKDYLKDVHTFINFISEFKPPRPIPRFIPLGGCGGDNILDKSQVLKTSEILEEFLKMYEQIVPFENVISNNPLVQHYLIKENKIIFGIMQPFSLEKGHFPGESKSLRINPNGYVSNNYYSSDIRFLPELSYIKKVASVKELIENKKTHNQEWYKQATQQPLKRDINFWRFGE